MSAKKKAVVTGGAGFIGSHLVEALVQGGWETIVVDDLSSGSWEKIPATAREKTKLVESPCNDASVMRRELAGADCLFHLAAVSSVTGSQKDPARSLFSGEAALFAAAQAAVDSGCGKMIYASSAAVYGDPVRLPIDEKHLCEPLSIYGLSKLSCERYLRCFARDHGLAVSCLRFFNVYGPRQDPSNPYSGVISKFMGAAARGLPLEITGDGEQTRDFIHVQDVVRACVATAERPRPKEPVDYEVVNIGSGAAVTINRLAQIIAATPGCTSELRHVAPRRGEIRHSVSNPAKARMFCAFESTVSLEAGLKDLMLV